MKKIACLFFATIFTNMVFCMHPADTSAQKILFLGNSITYAGNYVTDIEAYLVTHHLNRKYEIINAGLPSETVSGLSEEGHAGGQFPRPDLHERLDRVLAITHPDIVFACYGMNDGIYLPFDEERFQKFRDGINWLHKKITDFGAVIIHVTPPVYDELKGKKRGYANTLDKYADWIMSQQKTAGWNVADIHYPMKNFLEAHRKVDSAFQTSGFAFAEDGVHPNEVGHWIMAKSILVYFGEKEAAHYPDILSAMADQPEAAKILALISQRAAMQKDAWITAAGHKRPGMKTGLPLMEAQKKAKEIDREIIQLLR